MNSNQLWEASLFQKKQQLARTLELLERKRKRKRGYSNSLTVVTLDEAVRHSDFDAFQFAIQGLAEQFSQKKVSALIQKHLYPGLEHVRYFSQGIGWATSSDPHSSIIWGCLYIVIQCGCIFAESVEEIISQLAILENLLSHFRKDVNLYPDSKAVEFSMKTVFEDYIEFCLIIIRNMAKSPISVFIRNIYSSSLRRDLKKMKEKLRQDVAEFDRAVDGAERARAINADGTIIHTQNQLIALSQRVQGSFPANTSDPNQVQFPVQTVSMGENHDFSGREGELTKMYELLAENHTDNRPCSIVLHGIGGIGKTETALKFTYRYRKSFDGVFWVSADPEQETETLRTFGNIGRRLALFRSDSVLDPQVEAVFEWLENTERRWLVVFDNVVNWKSIARFWPMRSKGPSAIIVTSQKGAPWANHQMDLEPFDDQAGSQLLLQQMRMSELPADDPTRIITGKISHELGGSPLYLSHAHGFMALAKCPPEEYLDIIRTRSNTLDWTSDGTWRYGRAASTTHDKILKNLSPGATELLFMLAFMSPDDVTEDLLLIDHGFKELAFLNDRATYLSYIAELNAGRLVTRDTDGARWRLRMHRATQEAMLQKLNNNLEERERSFSRVIRLIRENFPDPSKFAKLQIAEAHVWPLITKVLPHLLSAFNSFERAWPSMSGDLFFAHLLSDIAGMDLYDRGKLTEAYKINKMVEKILKSPGCPPNNRLMADALAIVGLCTDFMAISNRDEGLEVRQNGVNIRQLHYASIAIEKVTLEDKIWLFNSYTDLVCSQQQINDFDGARKNLEECFGHYKSWGDENAIPYEYSKYYNQMAYVLLYENDSERAVEFSKRGYELVEQATPGTQIAILYKFDYANILFQHGDAKNALKIHRSLLKLCKHDCGKENVRTLEVRLNIGIISYFLGEMKHAEKHLRKALRLNERELWPVENITRGKFYLSQVLKANNPSDPAAIDMEREAKDSLEELLKLDNHGTAEEYRDNLPMLYDYLVHWECRLVTPRKKP